jgi:hypothetical protein
LRLPRVGSPRRDQGRQKLFRQTGRANIAPRQLRRPCRHYAREQGNEIIITGPAGAPLALQHPIEPFPVRTAPPLGVPPGNARCWKHRTMFPLFGSVAALGNGGRILSRARAVCSHWARSTRRWTGSVGRHSRHASGLPGELLRSGDDNVDMAPRAAIGPQINAR